MRTASDNEWPRTIRISRLGGSATNQIISHQIPFINSLSLSLSFYRHLFFCFFLSFLLLLLFVSAAFVSSSHSPDLIRLHNSGMKPKWKLKKTIARVANFVFLFISSIHWPPAPASVQPGPTGLPSFTEFFFHTKMSKN